jgi:hypothetical protein
MPIDLGFRPASASSAQAAVDGVSFRSMNK